MRVGGNPGCLHGPDVVVSPDSTLGQRKLKEDSVNLLKDHTAV